MLGKKNTSSKKLFVFPAGWCKQAEISLNFKISLHIHLEKKNNNSRMQNPLGLLRRTKTHKNKHTFEFKFLSAIQPNKGRLVSLTHRNKNTSQKTLYQHNSG